MGRLCRHRCPTIHANIPKVLPREGELSKGLRGSAGGEANLSLFHLIIQMQREGAIRFTQLIAEKDYRWLHISYVPGMLRNQVIDVNCCPAYVKYDTS